MKRKTGLCVIAVALTLTATARLTADEGMWLLNNLPKTELKQKYGFEPTQAWVDHVQKASVRFGNGGSASFISPNGLVMTNHHVGADAIQNLSTAEHNYMSDGFYAPTLADELKCPDVELNVLMEIRPVTDRINAAVTKEMSPADAATARQKAMSEIEREAQAETGLKPQIVTLYRGARYDLYLYKRYTDVRLVMAPEDGIGFFGGDLDNFNYPRYNLDISFFRAYEDGKPAKTPDYFRFSRAGIKENDLIFISGHPGRTRRLFTVAHLEFLRDTWLPLILNCYYQREVALIQLAARGEEQDRIAREDLLYIQNGRKAFTGMLTGLQDARIMAQKVQEEQALRSFWSTSNKDGKQDPWARLQSAINETNDWYAAYFLLENRRTGLCRLQGLATKLVRAATERAKPDADRLPEYRDASLVSLELDLFSEAPIHMEIERVRLEDGLMRLARILGGDHPAVIDALGGVDPGSRAAALLAGTKLADVAERKRLYEGGLAAVEASDDPMIKFAMQIDKHGLALRKQYEDTFESVETEAYADIADARFAKYGERVYPDATFTLRLAYGTVKGQHEDGRNVAPFTTIGGAFEHAESHHNRPPFDLPERWVKGKSKLDLSTPFNFITTNDIIGGNSGSPMLNRDGEIIGIVFDGNIESLVWDFQFDDRQARSVGVDARAIIEALKKLYGADALVKEITGGTSRMAMAN
ncbi:MAG: S46 family peptidase [Phycisphaerales bacterium]|nr:S46 family peptidase [Phycisphaerales bacterium]MCB9855989.1 S46 family peptidase [Phycisphaerales bacterium]